MIHVLIYTLHWKIGGIERVIQHLIAGLQPRGYRFSIVTEDTPNPDRQFDLGPDVPVYFRSFAPFTEQSEAAMRRLILRINPDVAIVMGSGRTVSRLPISLMGTDIPVILSEHNSTSRLRLAFDASSDFLNGTRSYADFVHVLMEDYGIDALEPERIRVIGNPVFPQARRANVASRPPGDPHGNVILSAARYETNQKQPDLLIKAFALIADRNPDWRLEFHGDDWKGNKARLEAMVVEYGLADRITLNGHSDCVPDLICAAQIFAFPSAFEGFSLAATEALSHGLPLVAFEECEGLNQIVVNEVNGLLVPGSVKDVEAYAAALERLMQDEALRLRLAAAGPGSMERFAPEAFYREWERLLKDAAALRGRNRLANLSILEREYLRLVGSGTLFDRAAQQRKALSERFAAEKATLSRSFAAERKKLTRQLNLQVRLNKEIRKDEKLRARSRKPQRPKKISWRSRVKGFARRITPAPIWRFMYQVRKAFSS